MGVAYFEKVLEPLASGGWKPIKLPPRALRTVDRYKTGLHGEFEGIYQRLEGDAATGGHDPVVLIPAEKLIRVTFDEQDGNFEGNGFYVDMYDEWKQSEELSKLYRAAMTRAGSGALLINHSGTLSQAEQDRWKKAGDKYTAGELSWLMLPEKFKAEITALHEPDTLLEHLRLRKRNIYEIANCEHLEQGSGSTGSYALASVQMDSFLLSLGETAKVIRDAVQSSLIEPLVDYNFRDGTPYPKLRFQLAKRSIAQIGETVGTLLSGGVVVPTPEVVKQMHEELGLPTEGIDEYFEERAKARPTMPPDGDDDGDEDSASAWEVRFQAEYRQDPTRDGSGAWRAALPIERQYQLIQFNDRWDDWVDEMARRLTKGADALVYALIDKVRRYLLANDLASAVGSEYTAAGMERLEKAVVAAVRAIADAAAQHFYDRAGLGDAPPFTAKELAIMKTLTVKRLTRFMDNAQGTLFRRLDTSTELLDALSRGEATEATVERFITLARSTYEKNRDSYLVAEGKAIVNNAAHRGAESMLRDDRVVKVMRSGLLDNRICVNCAELDGKVFDKAFATRYSPPAECMGGPWCRCVWIGILEGDSTLYPSTSPSELPSMKRPSLSSRRVPIRDLRERGIMNTG